MADLTVYIVAEILRAAVRLGADLKDFPERATPGVCYQYLEDVGADHYLLGVVGSWQDTQTDEVTLADLKRLNDGREFLEQLISVRN